MDKVAKKSVINAAFKHLIGNGATLLPASGVVVELSSSGKTAAVHWPAMVGSKKVVVHDVVTLAA